jgi:hypothetical protein
MLLPDEHPIGVLVTDPAMRLAFDNIVKQRAVQWKDLSTFFEGEQIDKTDGRAKLNVLKNANLIKEEPCDIDDFTTFYVTKEGLSVNRKLRRSEPGTLFDRIREFLA